MKTTIEPGLANVRVASTAWAGEKVGDVVRVDAKAGTCDVVVLASVEEPKLGEALAGQGGEIRGVPVDGTAVRMKAEAIGSVRLVGEEKQQMANGQSGKSEEAAGAVSGKKART